MLATKTAIDTAFIIAVKWTVGGAETLYVDRNTEDMEGTLPRIVSIGEIDEIRNGDSAGTTSAVTITLSDTDGALKLLFDTQDIHKRLVKVYQYFIGTSTSDKFLLFTGQISTPITWNEGKRTLSFDVVTKLEDLEVGFSAEMGRFESVAPNLIGSALADGLRDRPTRSRAPAPGGPDRVHHRSRSRWSINRWSRS
jgi:hypothetical protein